MGSKVFNISFGDLSGLNSFKSGLNLNRNSSNNTLPDGISVNPTLAQSPSHVIPNPQNADKKINYNNSVTYISAALALTSLGVAAMSVIKGRNYKSLVNETSAKLGEISSHYEDLTSQFVDISTKLNRSEAKNQSMAASLENFAKKIESIVSKNDDAVQKYNELKALFIEKGNWRDTFLNTLDGHVKSLQALKHLTTAPIERDMGYCDGIPLLQNLNNDKTRIRLPEDVIEWLNKAAERFIYKGDNSIPIKPLSKDSTVWSLTVESIPEKEGGLGEVPVQIARNLTKEFNIDNYLVRPISVIHGKSNFVCTDGKYQYIYNLDKPNPWKMDVDKIAEFETNVFRNGRCETQTVEVFSGVDPRDGYKRLMFGNKDFFTANGLYTNTQTASEPERYAFFPKAVYEFMKLKVDANSVTNYKIFNKDKFDAIKAPDAMILNDWHAGAIAALMRLKAPCEAGMKELSKTAAQTFKTMNLVNINHNLDYQGTSWEHTSDILNTLFDKYALDIYENANTGFGFNGINKVLITDGSVNLANMAACLSNKMKPVSPTYAKEVAHQPERSRAMQHVCDVRLSQGTMVGTSNGWDRVVNEVSETRIAGFNNSINSDKIAIFKSRLESLGGLPMDRRDEMLKILSNSLDAASLRVKIEELKKMNSPVITDAIEQMEREGITTLREFMPYTHADTTENILLMRKHNKQMFIDFLNNMIEHKRAKGDDLFNIGEVNLTRLSHLNPGDLDETVVFDMGVRFVSQKGVDVACDAIEKVLNNWDRKYHNKPKPVFVLGGADAEGGRINEFVVKLKERLGAENSKQVVHQVGFTPNNIYQGGSDFTLYSSHFEPDGAKWESLNKGTPVICTRVGGHVDSVSDGVNGFLTARTVPEIKKLCYRNDGSFDEGKYLYEMGNDFADSIWRAVDTFYNKDAYAKMVREAIDGDQSWLIKDGNGNIVGGPLLEHMKDLGFSLNDFEQIKV